LVELSSESIDHAEEPGQFIAHFTKTGEPLLPEILEAKGFVLGFFYSLIKETEATPP
jgi:hypothetical protein